MKMIDPANSRKNLRSGAVLFPRASDCRGTVQASRSDPGNWRAASDWASWARAGGRSVAGTASWYPEPRAAGWSCRRHWTRYRTLSSCHGSAAVPAGRVRAAHSHPCTDWCTGPAAAAENWPVSLRGPPSLGEGAKNRRGKTDSSAHRRERQVMSRVASSETHTRPRSTKNSAACFRLREWTPPGSVGASRVPRHARAREASKRARVTAEQQNSRTAARSQSAILLRPGPTRVGRVSRGSVSPAESRDPGAPGPAFLHTPAISGPPAAVPRPSGPACRRARTPRWPA